jgi:hypothetical protein
MLFLLIVKSLAEKQKMQILQTLALPDRDSNSRSTTLEASTLTTTPPMRLLYTEITKRVYILYICI